MRILAALGFAALTLQPALAQMAAPMAAPPPAPPRARGPALALAVDMAQTAIATCKTNGYKVTALIVDSAGVTVALLSGDSPERTLTIAPTKIAVVMRYKQPSGVIVMRAKTDPALTAELAADPKIGMPRQGGLPIMVGADMIGAIAVSGAPGGDKDEVCAQAALDKVKAQLK